MFPIVMGFRARPFSREDALPGSRRTRATAAILLALACSVALIAPAGAGPARGSAHGATGTHRYRLVLLRRGGGDTLSETESRRMQAGHLGNIRRMFELGALDAAGPFGDDTPLRGLFVFDADTLELDSLLAPDPLLSAGRLRAEAHTWIAPDGIGDAYRARGASDPGGRDSMVTFTFVMLHRGPRWTANATPELLRLLREQAKEFERWQRDGRLRLAGPIEGTGELRGVYVFDADTAATRALLARDPVVKAGRVVPEIHPWWTAFGIVPGP